MKKVSCFLCLFGFALFQGCGTSDSNLLSGTYVADTTIIRSILDLNGLTGVQIQSVATDSIFDFASSARRVTRLNLWGTSIGAHDIDTLPPSIGDLSELIYLDVKDNTIKQIPSTVGKLSKLAYLNVSNNDLIALPDSLRFCIKLTSLFANNNHISSLSANFPNITLLSDLHLESNNLTTLPSTIGSLSHLRVLTISSNYLTELPPSIMTITTLEYIEVTGNKLCELATLQSSVHTWLNTISPNYKSSQQGCQN